MRLGTDLWLPVAAAEDGPFTLAAEQWHGEPRLQGRLEGVLPGSRDIRLVLQKAP